jgi:hypothetical protein
MTIDFGARGSAPGRSGDVVSLSNIESELARVKIVLATPRKPPRPTQLLGRVVVLDLAFASEAGTAGFDKVTRPLIDGLGTRLAAWVDHHDSSHHSEFQQDPRFHLYTKAQHGACPELVTPELVQKVGRIDTVVCHNDFDGLASGAKWLRGGVECYPGCDADARAIDTRIGSISELGLTFDAALRAGFRNEELQHTVFRHLATGLSNTELWTPIRSAANDYTALRRAAQDLSRGFRALGTRLVWVDLRVSSLGKPPPRFDKTELLLLGQQRAPIAVLVEQAGASLAAPFDSGVDFLSLLGLSGGMPTRVSIELKRLPQALRQLGVPEGELILAGLVEADFV